MIKLNYNRLTSCAISSTPAPVLLHTSRESRREAMKQYTLLFVKSVLNATVYIDCRIDTLCFFANKDGFRLLDFEFYFCTWDSDYFEVMLRNIRPRIWQSLKHIALSLDVQDLFPDLIVFSKLQNLTTVSVVLPGPGQGHGKNYRLVDIPWSGCTHIRTEKSNRDPTGAAEFMDTAPCCTDCKQIICHILHLEYEIPYEWEPAEVLYQLAENFWFSSEEVKGWKLPQMKVQCMVTDSDDDWHGLSEISYPTFDPLIVESILGGY